MTLGEILDRTFEIYRKRFLLFVGIAAPPSVVLLALQLVDHAWVHTDRLLGPLNRRQSLMWGQVVWFGYFHISSFLAILFLPAFVRASSNILFDEEATILGSLRFAAERWAKYLWIACLKMAAQFLIPEALAAGVGIGGAFVLDKLGEMDSGEFIPILAVILVPLAGLVFLNLWLSSAFSFAIPAAALQGSSAVKAMRRSWLLTRGSRWRIFLAWAATFAGAWAMAAIVVALLQFAWFILRTEWHLRWFNQRAYLQLSYVSFAAIRALIGPIFPIAVTLLYYDQRVRKEGYDLEKMMEAAGLAVAGVAVVAKEDFPVPIVGESGEAQ
ncbi:MAG: hypothetical protein WDM87_05365 [Terracidiphilus sp.]